MGKVHNVWVKGSSVAQTLAVYSDKKHSEVPTRQLIAVEKYGLSTYTRLKTKTPSPLSMC